jgi:tetratricopeptide (TPR) repeat protein
VKLWRVARGPQADGRVAPCARLCGTAPKRTPLSPGFVAASRVLAFLAALALAPAICSGQSSRGASVEALIGEAQQDLAAGDADGAERLLLQARKIQPENAQPELGLAMVAEVRRQWSLALQSLDRAHRLDPALAEVWLQQGVVECNLHNFDAALPPLRRYLKLEPASQQGRYLAGVASFFTDRPEDAVRLLTTVWDAQVAASPPHLEYFYVLATAAEQTGDDKLSRRSLDRMVALGGDSTLLHLLAGRVYLNRDAPDLALPHLLKVAAAEPRAPLINFTVGIAYQQLKRYADARAAFERDLEVQPGFALDYARLGEIDNDLHRSHQAVGDYRQALAAQPHLAVAIYGMAVAEYRLDRLPAALDLLRQAAAIVPNAAEVHYLMARILQRQGHAAEARAQFDLSSKYRQKARKSLEQQFDRDVLTRINR